MNNTILLKSFKHNVFLINFYHFAKKFSKNDQNFYKFINIMEPLL